jgi:hypothetical protein
MFKVTINFRLGGGKDWNDEESSDDDENTAK